MAEATRQGTVSQIQVFEKGPAKAKVGTRSVRFWPNAYQSSEPSEVLTALRQAESAGSAVTVWGEEEQREGPQGAYTQFMAKSVELGGSSNGSSNGNGHVEPSYDSRQAQISAQWSHNAAIAALEAGLTKEQLGVPADTPMTVPSLAHAFLLSARNLAEWVGSQ